MGNGLSLPPCLHLPAAVRLVYWGGRARLLAADARITAGDVAAELPPPASDHAVCPADAFFVNLPIPVMSPAEELLPGRTYFVLPASRFPSVKVLTAATLAALSAAPAPASRGRSRPAPALPLAGQCPFEYVKAGDGGAPLIRVHLSRGEVLRDGAGGDDEEEARDDEVAELGDLVGPEGAEKRRGGVEEAADGEGGAPGGGAPGEEVGRRGESAAALGEPGLVGGGAGERVAEAAGGSGEGEEVAGAEVRGDQGEDVLGEGEDEAAAVEVGVELAAGGHGRPISRLVSAIFRFVPFKKKKNLVSCRRVVWTACVVWSVHSIPNPIRSHRYGQARKCTPPFSKKKCISLGANVMVGVRFFLKKMVYVSPQLLS